MGRRRTQLALDRLVSALLDLVSANADSNRSEDGCLPSDANERDAFKSALQDAVAEMTAEEDD
jgi:quinol monooxygenase YgiN